MQRQRRAGKEYRHGREAHEPLGARERCDLRTVPDHMNRSTTRIQIELPSTSMQRLTKLKEKTEATSYAEVTKNAYKLYERLIQMAESGQVLCVRDKDGTMRELEIFVGQ